MNEFGLNFINKCMQKSSFFYPVGNLENQADYLIQRNVQ